MLFFFPTNPIISLNSTFRHYALNLFPGFGVIQWFTGDVDVALRCLYRVDVVGSYDVSEVHATAIKSLLWYMLDSFNFQNAWFSTSSSKCHINPVLLLYEGRKIVAAKDT
jgi:hypothetical protein